MTDLYTVPLKLNAARAWRTYWGGKMIEELHGNNNAEDTHFPEEWIISTVCAQNVGREHIKDEGMSYVEGSELSLKAVIEADPEKALGKAHSQRFGCSTGVLVKLLDSAERLGIQVHPNKEKAQLYFNSEYGKTECWYIIGKREINGVKPCIYMGFKEGVTKELWREVFEKQDIPRMLDCLNRFEVEIGDTFFIKGGMPHAIGAGCFLAEIQEPTDYTLRTERVTPSGLEISDQACHYGIGFDKMFDCFEYPSEKSESAEELKLSSKITEKTDGFCVSEVVGYRDTDCFRLRRLEIGGEYTLNLCGSFCGLYILDGQGELVFDKGRLPVSKAEQYFVPAKVGKIKFISSPQYPLTILVSNGPKI